MFEISPPVHTLNSDTDGTYRNIKPELISIAKKEVSKNQGSKNRWRVGIVLLMLEYLWETFSGMLLIVDRDRKRSEILLFKSYLSLRDITMATSKKNGFVYSCTLKCKTRRGTLSKDLYFYPSLFLLQAVDIMSQGNS